MVGSRLRRDRRPLLIDIGIGLIGLSLFLRIKVIGDIFFTEGLLILLLPYLLMREEPLPQTNRPQRFLLTLGAFWLLSETVSNLVNETAFNDWARGLSKIVFLILNYIAMRRLLNTDRRLMMFAVGLLCGTALKSATLGLTGPHLWKFYLGAAVAGVLLVIAGGTSLRRHSWLPVALLILIATYSAFQSSRSLAGVCLMAASVLAAGLVLRAHPRVTFSWRVLATLSLVCAGFGIYVGFGSLVANGYLGDKAKKSYEDQVKRGEGSLLLGGRAEWRASLLAIRDSPLIGHGSWAKDADYANTYRSRLYAETGQIMSTATSEDAIPSHSFVTGAWIQGGFLGALFWLYVLWLALSSLFHLLTWRPPLGPVAVFLATQLLWDIPFSPFGGEMRVYEAFVLVILPIAAAPAIQRREGNARSRIATSPMVTGYGR